MPSSTKTATTRSTSKKVANALAAARGSNEASRKRGEALLALIARRMDRIKEDFFDIGMALHEIQTRKLYAALGFRSFFELVDARVGLARTQAGKLVAIAQSYDREEALALGVEKAFELIRYTEATPEPDSPKVILESGTKIRGKTPRAASVRELQAATKAVRAKHAAPKAKSAEQRAAEAAAKKLQAKLHKLGARSANVTVVRGEKGLELRIALSLADSDRI